MNTDWLWYLGILIILLTLTALILLRMNGVSVDTNFKYFAGAIGIAGFSFAVLGDGLFITAT